jgi:hypothetical protein
MKRHEIIEMLDHHCQMDIIVKQCTICKRKASGRNALKPSANVDEEHNTIYTIGSLLNLVLACPKNEEGRTGAYAQTDANTTDRQNQNRQTQAEQADAIGSNETQTEVRQGDNNRIETDKQRHRRNEHRITKITICSRRRRRIN